MKKYIRVFIVGLLLLVTLEFFNIDVYYRYFIMLLCGIVWSLILDNE